MQSIPTEIQAQLERARERLQLIAAQANPAADRDAIPDGVLERLLIASDFALDTLCSDPELAAGAWWVLAHDTRALAARWPPSMADGDEREVLAGLRRFRRRESLRLIVRDLLDLDGVDQTLSGATALAEFLLQRALEIAERRLIERHGVLRSADGEAVRLSVFGMGKLGGGELNFSSDIDLILAYSESASSDGARSLDAEDYTARLAQRLVQLLATPTEDGFAFRVDLRLRPFGTAGRLALNFNAMEQYYQREGRDWERYAWIKARTVAGDIDAGARLIESLRPFVYRRYLDYSAIDGLREMKALIDAEVARKDLAEHLKLGPGGIREIEFIVQLVQLIYGGREPGLRTTGLLAALAVATQLGHFDERLSGHLAAAYRFLRRVENRVQMLRDEQTHSLPESAIDRERLVAGLGFASQLAFEAELDAHRAVVAEAFAAVLAPRRRAAPAGESAYRDAWAAVVADRVVNELVPFAPDTLVELVGLAKASPIRALEQRARQRLDRLMPRFIAAAAKASSPDLALVRVARLILAIAGRPSYLALLDERPAARERVVEIFSASAFLAERVIAHPLLLDELLDERGLSELPDAESLAQAFARRRAGLDAEELLALLHEERQAAAFRLGLAFLHGRATADQVVVRLADIAAAVIQAVLAIAESDASAQFGALADRAAGSGIVVLGYGSLGGGELGFASDLDLVFVYDGALSQRLTIGAREIEGSRYVARVAQRVVHWLTTPTRAGPLYAIDVRLRPDGGKGLLVVTLEAFAEYQLDRAWPFEHQALIRARAVAGDLQLAQRVGRVRAQVLAKQREAPLLLAEIHRLRQRWRTELDRSRGDRFDLKQGRGGLVDIEFIAQALVLSCAAAHPDIEWPTRTTQLLELLAGIGALSRGEADDLCRAHARFVASGLSATLDLGPRVVPLTDELQMLAARVIEISRRVGLEGGTDP